MRSLSCPCLPRRGRAGPAVMLVFALGACAGTGDGDGDDNDDAGVPGPCDVGASAEGDVGAEGGSVALCGASASIAAGVLVEPVHVVLRVVALEPPAPFPLAYAGAAFAVDVDALPGEVLDVRVPHESTTRHLFFFRVDGGGAFSQIEACTVDDDVIGQSVGAGGTFVALADTVDFPPSTNGLGSGVVDATLLDQASHFELDDPEAFGTFAIHDESEAGERTVTVAANRTVADAVETFRVTFVVGADDAGNDTAAVVEVSFGSTADPNGLWSYLPFGENDASLDVVARDGAHVTGTLHATMTRGAESAPLTAELDVVSELFRFAPELSCGQPEG